VNAGELLVVSSIKSSPIKELTNMLTILLLIFWYSSMYLLFTWQLLC